MRTSDKSSISIVVSIIAIFISLWSAVWTFYVNEPYLILRDPKLRIWINSFGDFSSSVDYVTNRYSVSKRDNEIPLCIFNDGRGVTGHIYVHWNTEWANTSLAPMYKNIDFIEGGQGECFGIGLFITCKNIAPKYPYPYNDLCNASQIKSQIPLGKQTITLNVECTFCKQRKYNETFTICIWQNNSSECKMV